jgi:cytochrome c oxidase subunit 2
VGERATTIAVAYSIVVVLGLAISFGLYLSTRSRGPTDQRKLAERERTWLAIVVGVLVAFLLGTIFLVPYDDSAGAGKQVVRVTAKQFAWSIEPSRVQAGEPVEFRTRSSDVNHGFGVYTSGNRFLFQVQVIPGKEQRVVHTFEKPGTYRVLCLEYCGLAHHGMVAQFEVAP